MSGFANVKGTHGQKTTPEKDAENVGNNSGKADKDREKILSGT